STCCAGAGRASSVAPPATRPSSRSTSTSTLTGRSECTCADRPASDGRSSWRDDRCPPGGGQELARAMFVGGEAGCLDGLCLESLVEAVALVLHQVADITWTRGAGDLGFGDPDQSPRSRRSRRPSSTPGG